MLCKSLLLSRQALLVLSRASLARKVIAPRIVRVHGLPEPPRAFPPPINSPNPKYDESILFENQFNDNKKRSEKKSHKSNKQQSSKANKQSNDSFPRYDKECDKDNKFRTLMTNMAIKSRREKMNMIILEGKRLINDAIEAGIKLENIFFVMEDHLQDIKNLAEITELNGTQLTKVLYKDMKIFSPLSTSPGIMAVAEKPTPEQIRAQQNVSQRMPVTLLCDNIRDPGNMGTILRTSAAAGIDKIVLTAGCVDPWNSKVIQSGAGAHFHIPITNNVAWSSLRSELPDKFDLYIADASLDDGHTLEGIECLNFFNVNFFGESQQECKVLIVSNEAFGPSSQSFELAHKYSGCRVQIPLYQEVDSLNSAIASSILLYEMRKQFERQRQLAENY